MSGLRWAVVHAPADPAAAAWRDAAAAVHAPEPRLVPWAEVLNGDAKFAEGELVHAERLTPVTPARYGGSRERYERFGEALEILGGRLAAAGAHGTADAAQTLLALDRERCTGHLAAAAVPVPEAGTATVRPRFAEPCDAISTMYSANIATPLALVRTRAGLELRHTLERHYYGERDVDTVRGLLDGDETFAVGELTTAYLCDEQQRFRFAVVDGRVTHAAGRFAERLLAREYYGGRRREIEHYHERFGAAAWQRLIGIAEQAAAAFPGLRSIGVDIAASQTGGPDVVYDIDPFGARLPGALGLPGTAGEGLEVAATALRAALAGRAPAS